MSNNQYSFEELYEQLYNLHFEELEKLRNESKSKISKYFPWIGMTLAGFGAAGICWELGVPEETHIYWILWGVMILGFLGIMVVFGKAITKWTKEFNILDEKGNINDSNLKVGIKETQPYKYAFKEKIIKPIVECAVPESTYTADKGLSEQEYYSVWEKADRFSSEDELIMDLDVKDNENNKLQLIISDVLTQNEEQVENGGTTCRTIFHGLAGYTKLSKNIGACIKIIENNMFFKNKSKDYVEMDMQEFEKIFDVETNDKIKAVQVLTSDVMTELINVVKKLNIEFEIYINYNILHIRFYTGEMFEPQIFGKSMQLEKLKRYYDIMQAVKHVTEKMCNTVNELEI